MNGHYKYELWGKNAVIQLKSCLLLAINLIATISSSVK